jgi:hypothetical protein
MATANVKEVAAVGGGGAASLNLATLEAHAGCASFLHAQQLRHALR